MDSRVGRMLAAIVRASIWRPWATVLLSILLALGAGLYTLRVLDFLTSPLRLLPQRARYVALLNQYLEDFSELDDIIVAVEAPSPNRAKGYADRLVRTLRHEGLQSRITYRIDPSFFDRRGLLYLVVDDLVQLRDRLFDYDELIRSYAASPSLVRLLELLNQQFANAITLGFLDLGLGEHGEADLRFVNAVVDQTMARLDGTALYVSPWAIGFSLGSLDDPDAGYYFSSDKRLLFLFVEEKLDEGDFMNNRGRIATIRLAISKLAPEFTDVRAGVTGGPTIADDEMATAFRDSALATGLAAVLTLLVLLAAYRRPGTALLLLATLAVSLLWALGIITLFVGHLSVFSIMFLSLVIGVGIDYGIYFLCRFQEEGRVDASITEAMRRTADRTGPGMLLGALTAAGTFFVLMLTDFQGIREFGFVSGVSILMAFLSMLTLLPALIVIDGRLRGRRLVLKPSSLSPRDRPESLWLVGLTTYRKTILAAAGGLSAVGAWGVLGVTFDYNMLKLQAPGIESVLWEERILASAGRSGISALTTAGSLDELRRKQDAFSRLSSVSDVESVLQLVPDDQPEKIRIINQFAPLVAGIRVAEPPALEPATLRAPLLVLRRHLRLAAESITDEQVRADVQRLSKKIERALAKLDRTGLDAFESLGRLQGELHQDFVDKLERFKKDLDPQPVRVGDAPDELRGRYVGRSGRYLLRIHPAVDIWDKAGARRFIEDLRRVDPDVTGPPVTNFEATRLIERGYFEGAPYALLLVVAVTLAVLRTVRGTALSLAPVVLGALWTLGVMRLVGLEFNLANVWALPLIIGTAAEYGLNIFVRFLEGLDSGGPRYPNSVVVGVILSWLTTIAGFGSLMVAHHRGIFALGALLCIGSTASLVAAIFVLPVLIGLLVKSPVTARVFGVSIALALGILSVPLSARAQPSAGSSADGLPSRWEFSLDGQVGIPRGYVKVDENEAHGTKLRLHDLGIDISGALEGGAAFHFTPRDAIRGTFLYYFLDGGTNVPQSIAYNGEMFGPGHVDTNTDFYRVSLDYDRELLNRPLLVLTGTAGLTYVHLQVTLSGQGKSSPESFFQQELPVPILGLRADIPLADRVAARVFVAGGGLPPVSSLRQEGGTIYLSQAHADVGVSVTYRITRAVEAEAGYRLTYFFQHEKSHEDDNTFQLIDNGFRLALSFRF